MKSKTVTRRAAVALFILVSYPVLASSPIPRPDDDTDDTDEPGYSMPTPSIQFFNGSGTDVELYYVYGRQPPAQEGRKGNFTLHSGQSGNYYAFTDNSAWRTLTFHLDGVGKDAGRTLILAMNPGGRDVDEGGTYMWT
ncbi:MAG: hypothetical protein ACRC5A_16435, partial [Enterobacteriaceae bacterium]